MQRGCNITFQRRSLLHYWNWCSLILSPYTPINHLKDPASAPRDPGSRRGNKRCKLVAYCLKYKSLLLQELVLTGTGKWLHFSENLCRCQSWEIFTELPSRQTCSKTRLCVIFTGTTSTSLLFLSLLPKKLKPKHQPYLLLETNFELKQWDCHRAEDDMHLINSFCPCAVDLVLMARLTECSRETFSSHA